MHDEWRLLLHVYEVSPDVAQRLSDVPGQMLEFPVMATDGVVPDAIVLVAVLLHPLIFTATTE
jgi:hypothetical protein